MELTFSDANGNLPPNICTWQFNFAFDPDEDMHFPVTIMELKNCGMHLDWLKRQGIDPAVFGELFISSGLVLNDQIQWVSVIGCNQGFFEPVKGIPREQLPDNVPIQMM